MTRQILYCIRCGYQWMTHEDSNPKNCPKCKSPYWNKEITRISVSQARKKGLKI